jgi:hypothetical protein
MAKVDGKMEGETDTLDPAETPHRVPTEEGFKLTVVLGTAPNLILTFNTQALRDLSAEQIQNSVKRGAMPKGFKVRAREGVFLFCNVLYVFIDTGDISRKG